MQIIKMNKVALSIQIWIDFQDILLNSKNKDSFYVTISTKETRGKKGISF